MVLNWDNPTFSQHSFFYLLLKPIDKSPALASTLKLTHNKGAGKPPTFKRHLAAICESNHGLFSTKGYFQKSQQGSSKYRYNDSYLQDRYRRNIRILIRIKGMVRLQTHNWSTIQLQFYLYTYTMILRKLGKHTH